MKNNSKLPKVKTATVIVIWTMAVDIEVDPTRMNDSSYVEKIRDQAKEIATEFLADEGFENEATIGGCEQFPKLVE